MSENPRFEYAVSPEQIATHNDQLSAKIETPKRPNQTEAGKPKHSEKHTLKFYKFPPAVIDGLVAADYGPAWKVAMAICKRWYATFRGNPVELTTWNLRKNYGLSKDQKWRALKVLEDTEQYIVERIPGHNPLVTMKWEPLKKPNQY
jgi:hypothetical protein